MKLYPFITHLPVILFLILYCKRPPLISISSVLTAYLSCQIPKWIGSVTAAVTGKYFTEHLAYLVTMCIVYFLIKKYVADSVIQFPSAGIWLNSRSCFLEKPN
jgi:L-lactate permease